MKNNLPISRKLKYIIHGKIDYLKSFKYSFKESLYAWQQSRRIYNFDNLINKNKYFDNKVKIKTLKESAPYPVLISNSKGISLIKDNKKFNILNTSPGFYVFGLIVIKKRILASINFHLPIKSYPNVAISKRISILVSTDFSNIEKVINGNASIVDWDIIQTDKEKSYSYLNFFQNYIYAADYLGKVDIFKIKEKNKFNLEKIHSIDLTKNYIHYPTYFYPYLHLNCVSADENYFYVGLHAYSKMTSFNSSLYKVEHKTKKISLEKNTNFISGHDMMIVDNNFYGVDSPNGFFYKNNKCIFKTETKSFLRGLSINENGFALGASIFSSKRSDREAINGENKILFINKDGSLNKCISPNLSTIYRIFALDTFEYSQSSPVNVNI